MPMVLAENKRTLWPAGKTTEQQQHGLHRGNEGSVQLSAWGSVPFVAVKWTVKSMFTESPATVRGQISKVGPAHRSDPMTLTRAGDDLNINARRLQSAELAVAASESTEFKAAKSSQPTRYDIAGSDTLGPT